MSDLAATTRKAWTPRRIFALSLLILGAIGFLASLGIEGFWSSYPEILLEFGRGQIPQGDEALAVAAILMLPAVLLGAPALLIWLEMSRVLTWVLRFCAASLAGSLTYFFVTEPTVWQLLGLLTASSILTLVGLFIIEPGRAPDSAPH